MPRSSASGPRGTACPGRAHRTEDRFVGVELFQIETYDSRKAKGFPADPIQIALGILSGQLAPEAANPLNPTSNVSSGSPTKAPAVAQV